MTKIDIIRTFKYGGSKMKSIAIPEVYSRDNNIDYGDEFEIYREIINGKDALVLIPVNGKYITEPSSKSQESN